ncbi:MAG: hypothetical protein FP817_07770 [Propionicimonas sp.]|nr:hypothetical protein [Propionicimonas sp.]
MAGLRPGRTADWPASHCRARSSSWPRPPPASPPWPSPSRWYQAVGRRCGCHLGRQAVVRSRGRPGCCRRQGWPRQPPRRPRPRPR